MSKGMSSLAIDLTSSSCLSCRCRRRTADEHRTKVETHQETVDSGFSFPDSQVIRAGVQRGRRHFAGTYALLDCVVQRATESQSTGREINSHPLRCRVRP